MPKMKGGELIAKYLIQEKVPYVFSSGAAPARQAHFPAFTRGHVAACLAPPERPCIAVVGDGGFTMTPYVLCTAVEFNLPCIWVVWNNFAWGAIRDIQYGLGARLRR